MDVRAYSPADRAACLAVFDSNTPRFFDPAERRGLETFLDAVDCSYFVMEHNGAIAGCGGYAIAEDTSLASLPGEWSAPICTNWVSADSCSCTVCGRSPKRAASNWSR